MGIEIERKFLTRGDGWRTPAEGTMIRQGYLNSARERVVRVRAAGDEGYLTVKGITTNASRAEFEYAIPADDAAAMLDDLCEKPLIEKIRYRIDVDGLVWEVDVFLGDNRGLVVAEVELESAEHPFAKPEWVGEEVTGDPRYFNSNLVRTPYTQWRHDKS